VVFSALASISTMPESALDMVTATTRFDGSFESVLPFSSLLHEQREAEISKHRKYMFNPKLLTGRFY
jgi:hypothetical protein